MYLNDEVFGNILIGVIKNRDGGTKSKLTIQQGHVI